MFAKKVCRTKVANCDSVIALVEGGGIVGGNVIADVFTLGCLAEAEVMKG